MKWKWYVYILECLDNSYYTGKTWNASLRYDQHISGLGGEYTKKHGVKKFVYLEEHDDFETASFREKQIHGWTRKKRKINKWRMEKGMVSLRQAQAKMLRRSYFRGFRT